MWQRIQTRAAHPTSFRAEFGFTRKNSPERKKKDLSVDSWIVCGLRVPVFRILAIFLKGLNLTAYRYNLKLHFLYFHRILSFNLSFYGPIFSNLSNSKHDIFYILKKKIKCYYSHKKLTL